MTLASLPVNAIEKDARALLERHGKIINLKLALRRSTGSGSSLAHVQYSSPASASDAVYELNGFTYRGSKLAARLTYAHKSPEIGRLGASIVRISMPAPGVAAYTGYDTKEAAEKVIKNVHGSIMKKQTVGAYLHDGSLRQGKFTVRFEGLPFDIKPEGIAALGGGNIPEYALLYTKAAYNSLSTAANMLRQIFEEHGDVISIDFPPVPPLHGRVSGTIRFASSTVAAGVCAHHNGRKFAFLNRCTDNPEFKDKRQAIYLEHLHKLVFRISAEVHAAVEIDLLRLSRYAEGRGVKLRTTRAALGDFEIEMTGSKLRCIRDVKLPLERILAGQTVLAQDKPIWDNFFTTNAGTAFIHSVSSSTRTCIRADRNRCFIKVWGRAEGRARARAQIMGELKKLHSERRFGLPLRGKLLTKVMFDQLESIYDELGRDNVQVDLSSRKLMIRGTEQQFKWTVETLAREVSESLDQRSRESQDGCPICLDAVTDAIILECGHRSCRRCITRYLTTATDHRAFPLKCLGNSGFCSNLIPLFICDELLRKEQFAAVVDASFFSYIHSHPSEFHFCPTADCQQIYRTSARAVELQCPSCLVYICPTCHGEQHMGEECGVVRAENERLFLEWKNEHDVKSCPRCTSEIEKVDGCNHMICAYCGTHMCWICLETFDQPMHIFAHLEDHVASGGS